MGGRTGDEPAINVTWDGMTDTCWEEPDNYADVRFTTSGDVEYNVVTVRIFIPTNYGSQSGQYLISVGDFTCEQIDYAQKDTWAESTCPAGTVGHEVEVSTNVASAITISRLRYWDTTMTTKQNRQQMPYLFLKLM